MDQMNCEAEPYRELAGIYDELVGNTAFDCWRENFDRLVNRNGIEFTTAADIACGTGLAARYLAGTCARVYAIDKSAEMLDEARARCGLRNIVFIRQQFTELELPERVDMLTSNFDSLNYLTDEGDLAESLRRFGESVRPGGHAIFDLNTSRELEAGWGDAVMVHRLTGAFSLWESSWDPGARINTLRMTNFIERENGSYDKFEEVHRERAYDLDFILQTLDRAGFAAVETYDAKGLSAVNSDTRRVQFLARR